MNVPRYEVSAGVYLRRIISKFSKSVNNSSTIQPTVGTALLGTV
eukprot:SAG31_NODE_1930_length_6881_cov_6.976998_2_plen_44_part_00